MITPQPIFEDATRYHLARRIEQWGWEVGAYTYGAPQILEPNLAHLKIGRFCSFGPGATIILGNHRTDSITTYPFKALQRFWPTASQAADDHDSKGDVVIQDDVWIGANSTILSGVTIGHGSVVAAGSLVRADVPPYAIVAGNPAHVIRFRFDQGTISRLLRIAWWNWDEEIIQQHVPLLLDKDIRPFLETAERAMRQGQGAMDLSGLAPQEIAVRATRRALAHVYLRGSGVEVGSGGRPVILPAHATCHYGDIRDAAELEGYFRRFPGGDIPVPLFIDAQTFAGVDDGHLDFVISAHVTEHLKDPFGAIYNALRVLKPGGIFMLILPDKRFTFDSKRPGTPIEHLMRDFQDGGASTERQAYQEWVRLVHDWPGSTPTEVGVEALVEELMAQGADIHFHAWDDQGFLELMQHVQAHMPASLECLVPVENENIAILRRTEAALAPRHAPTIVSPCPEDEDARIFPSVSGPA